MQARGEGPSSLDEVMYEVMGLRPGDPVQYLTGSLLVWTEGTLSGWRDEYTADVITRKGRRVVRKTRYLRRPEG